MRSVRYHENGGPDVLCVEEVERPAPREEELLVDVRAASINPVDELYREGILGGDDDGAFEGSFLPSTAGTDLAGVVTEIGPAVDQFQPGDRVFGTGMADSSHATMAEYAVVPADHVGHLPDTIDFEVGAGIAHVGGTAWRALIEFGKLAPSETCLIHGASGGVGHVAVQLAAATGAEVVGTAGSERARQLVADLGADVVLDYNSDDLQSKIAAATDGVDLILDHQTGEYLELDIGVAANQGRIVHLSGAIPAMDHPGGARTKEITIQGVAMHNTPDIGAVMNRLAYLLENEDITVHIDRTFELDEAAAAYRTKEKEQILGKLVITT